MPFQSLLVLVYFLLLGGLQAHSMQLCNKMYCVNTQTGTATLNSSFRSKSSDFGVSVKLPGGVGSLNKGPSEATEKKRPSDDAGKSDTAQAEQNQDPSGGGEQQAGPGQQAEAAGGSPEQDLDQLDRDRADFEAALAEATELRDPFEAKGRRGRDSEVPSELDRNQRLLNQVNKRTAEIKVPGKAGAFRNSSGGFGRSNISGHTSPLGKSALEKKSTKKKSHKETQKAKNVANSDFSAGGGRGGAKSGRYSLGNSSLPNRKKRRAARAPASVGQNGIVGRDGITGAHGPSLFLKVYRRYRYHKNSFIKN